MKQITLGSLFDGIGGWPLAALHAGAKAVWASEIEKFPQAVTKIRFPNMAQLGDIAQIDGAEIEPVDIICMGSPCQDLSVAGRQKGLEGEKSGLFYTAVNVISRMRTATKGRYPRFVVWENVPGAFNSNRGADFRAVLEAFTKVEIPMPGSGKWAPAGMVRSQECDVAWRVLDAQYWGVPQRRKRIFLVADFTDGERCADKVLFECESLPRDIASGGETREGTAGGIEGSTYQAVAGFSVEASIKDNNPVLHELTPTMRAKTRLGVCAVGFKGGAGSKARSLGYAIEKASTLPAKISGLEPTVMIYENHGQDSRIKGPLEVSPAINAQAGTDGNNLPLVCHSYCIAGNTIDRQTQNGGNGKGVSKEVSYTLNTIDRHAVAYGLGWNSFNQGKNSKFGPNVDKELQPALVAKGAGAVVVAVDCRNLRETKTCGTLQAKENGGYSLNFQNPIRTETIVRRLTPLECERLQGLPDNWTLIDDKSCSDTARYKALGNGMAQPCADFIIRQIAKSF